MTSTDFPPGTRVAVDEFHGVIVESTVDDLTYAADSYVETGPEFGHVIVQFDGDEQDGDGGWYHPDDLRRLP